MVSRKKRKSSLTFHLLLWNVMVIKKHSQTAEEQNSPCRLAQPSVLTESRSSWCVKIAAKPGNPGHRSQTSVALVDFTKWSQIKVLTVHRGRYTTVDLSLVFVWGNFWNKEKPLYRSQPLKGHQSRCVFCNIHFHGRSQQRAHYLRPLTMGSRGKKGFFFVCVFGRG